MRDAEAVTFAGGRIDRSSGKRTDPAAIAAFAADPAARALALWRGQPLLEASAKARAPSGSAGSRSRPRSSPRPRTRRSFSASRTGLRASPGRSPTGPASATATGPCPSSTPRRTPHPDLPERFVFGDLRSLMAELTPEEAGTAAAAKGILGWHATHRFCANCGARLGGDRRRLAPHLPGLRRPAFPAHRPGRHHADRRGQRPAARALAGLAAGMYSLLAGFMEPGESIEAAVRREVFEETAVRGRAGRLSREPALALPVEPDDRLRRPGATSRTIKLDPVELDDARWVSREDVLAGLAGLDPGPPPRPQGLDRPLPDRALARRPPRLKRRKPDASPRPRAPRRRCLPCPPSPTRCPRR